MLALRRLVQTPLARALPQSILRPSVIARAFSAPSHPRVTCVPVANAPKPIPGSKPESPWLQYEWQMTNMTSIMHRLTGAWMTVVLYSCLFLWTIYCSVIYGGTVIYLANGASATALVSGFAHGPAFLGSLAAYWFIPKALLKISIIVPMNYHFLNGIRHLAWDCGSLLELPALYASGRQAIAAAAVFSGLATVYFL